MKRFLFGAASLTVAAFLAGAPDFGSAQSAQPWSTFHGNAQRTGVSAAAGPTSPFVQRQWSLNREVESSPAVDASGVAYVGDDDGYVYALDPSQPYDPTKPNATKWTFKTGGKVISSPTLSSDGKTLYVGSEDGNIYALKTADGTKVWSANLSSAIHSSPLLSPDGSTLYVNNVNGSISALKASDGTKVWGPYNLGTAIPGSMALSPDGATLYFAGYTGDMYALAASNPNGNQAPTHFYLPGHASSSPVVDTNGNVYVGTQDGVLLSYSPGSSNPRWSYTVPSHQPIFSTPAVANGIVVFGDSDGYLYDVSPSSGQPVWNGFPHTGAAIDSSPAIASNNVIYVGSRDGYFYAFSGQTGQILWTYNKSSSPVVSSPAIGPDGSVWVGTDAQPGFVYRFTTLANPPSAPPTGTLPPTATPTNTPVGGPTATPTPTSISGTPGPIPKVSLKAQVKAGAKQTIKVTTIPNTIVRFRVVYPNTQHQSKSRKSNASGIASYTYTQGASKTLHNRFVATVIVKVGNPPNRPSATATYRIGWGKIDASVEPRTQAVGKIVNVYVHTTLSKRVVAYLLFPNGKLVTLYGRTGPHKFMHKRYKIPRGWVTARNRKVKVLARLQSGRPPVSTQTFFMVK